MSVTSSPIDWYAARAAGIVAYLLLTTVVLVGLTLSGRLNVPRWPRFAVTDVHRFGGILVGVFVSIHVATIALDSYTPFSFTQLLVPFVSRYRPMWTGVGIVAVELLVAIAITNAVRARIPYRWWRRVHILTFAVWGAATVHGIGAGTDTPASWMTLLYAAAVASVLAALGWRLARRRLAPGGVGALAVAGCTLGVVTVLGLAVALRPAAHPRAAAAVPAAPVAFADAFTGSMSQQTGAAGELLSVVGRGTGRDPVLVRIDLVSPDGQTVTDTALQLENVASGAICRGTVSAIGAGGFSGSCSYTSGSARTVAGNWQLAGQTVTGNLRVTG